MAYRSWLESYRTRGEDRQPDPSQHRPASTGSAEPAPSRESGADHREEPPARLESLAR